MSTVQVNKLASDERPGAANQRGMRRLKQAFLLTVLLLVLAVAAVWAVQRGSPGAAGITGAAAQERPGVPVQTAVFRQELVVQTVRGVGTLRASAMVEIRPEIAGRIRSLNFEEGSEVEAGHLLFEIDDEKLQRQLAAARAARRSAEARAEHARRTLEQHEQMRTAGAGTDFELDRVRSELDTALAEQERMAAEVELMEVQLSDTRILAPFSGRISERRIDPGGYVTTGQSLATLYQADPLDLAFTVPDRQMGRIQRGQTVRIGVDAFPGRLFDATVDFVSPAVDESTRSFLVKARVPNTDGRLMPGAFATALVTVEERQAPVIPEETLIGTRQGYIVFVIEDGISQMREVETGLRQNSMVEITSGLDLGEVVVRAGHMRLNGGERVEIIAPEGTAQGEAGGDT